MIVQLVVAGLAVVAPIQQTDTIIPVRSESRLYVENFRGSVTIRAWNRDEMRIVADHSSRAFVEITGSSSTVRLRGKTTRGALPVVDYELTVPQGVHVDVGGTFTDVEVEGVDGEVRATTVHGDVRVVGVRGLVTLESVQGDLHVSRVQGRLDAESTNGTITIEDASGPIHAATVNGAIHLDRIESNDVDVSTTNGPIRYDGTVDDDGRYVFTNHNGNLDITIPDGVNATVRVSTFHGEFEPAFPVTLDGVGGVGRSFSFTIGGGDARMELESFGGKIRLRRR